MIGYVIKFDDGTYYAGYNKKPSKDIIGAKIYRSYRKANLTINVSESFKNYCSKSYVIMRVKIEEVETVEV